MSKVNTKQALTRPQFDSLFGTKVWQCQKTSDDNVPDQKGNVETSTSTPHPDTSKKEFGATETKMMLCVLTVSCVVWWSHSSEEIPSNRDTAGQE